MKDKITIEDLEHILASPNNGKVEVTPSGEVRVFGPEEPREQGPARVLTAEQALGDHY